MESSTATTSTPNNPQNTGNVPGNTATTTINQKKMLYKHVEACCSKRWTGVLFHIHVEPFNPEPDKHHDSKNEEQSFLSFSSFIFGKL
jgi:hypothetical protein